MSFEVHEKAKVLVQQALTGEIYSKDEIEETLDWVLTRLRRSNPEVELDRSRLLRELEAALDVFQADSIAMEDTTDHVDWLPERKESIEWRFWDRYRRYLLEQERLPPQILERLDTTTFRVLRKLENPDRPGPWDRRGMVVGQIQSGKTGHYTGLICRAADAGYRLIVVLAGIHDSLRSQTQLRLDAGFLGFDTQLRLLAEDDDSFAAAALGVGRLLGARRLPVASLTTSHEKGDFGKKKATGSGILIGDYPVLLVVKKHRRILDNLREWVETLYGRGDPKRVRDFALLLIDDEADNASINTLDPKDPSGNYADVDPTKVNGAIRLLLNVFEKKAYVGYTATPYANIYIPEWEHGEYGPDLFPASFIEYLRPPSNYFGPLRLFGLGDDDRLPLFRSVNDHTPWVPDRHKHYDRVGPLPESLREAMRSFVLARAIRLARGQANRHNSMLVHVTRFKAVQQQVREQVEDELHDLRARLRYGDGGDTGVRGELRSLWERDFVPTTAHFEPDSAPRPVWEDIEHRLDEAIEPITVKTINGEAQDALEYFEHQRTGLNVIAVGGDKLSRGLTLEGLTVSYYLRTSRAYDTLLQMGRWFGYRSGYEDLCRLWTTSSLWQAYRGVTAANEELIREFEEMAALGRTPADYGLRVQGSVAGMLVTAPNKMRAGTPLRVGFSGAIAETVVLPCDRFTADQNLTVAEEFITAVAAAATDERRPTENYLWAGVPGEVVADQFFARFQTDETAWRVHAPTIGKYIQNRLGAGELTTWTVVLVSRRGAPRTATIAGREIGLTERSVLEELGDRVAEGRYSIRRILNPPDERLDMEPELLKAAMEDTRRRWQEDPGERKEPTQPDNIFVRRRRTVTRGHLVLYPIAFPPENLDLGDADVTDGPLIGFAVSFPHSPDAPAVEYVVNERFLKELFGDDE